MPYLSNNYRFQPKSKLQNLLEAASFLVFSAGAILLTLFLLGWFSAASGELARPEFAEWAESAASGELAESAATENGIVAGADNEIDQIANH